MSRRESEHETGGDARVAVIVVAGGTGDRFGSAQGKQLAQVAGVPVLAHALRALDRAQSVTEFVVVVHADRVDEYRLQAVEPADLTRPVCVVAAGESRAQSVRNGLGAVDGAVTVVAIHDGARPLVTPECLDAAVRAVLDEPVDGVVVGHPAFDTLKVVEGTRVIDTPDRSRYWVAQTPQVFDSRVLREAYDDALRTGFVGTDDASYVEHAGGLVRMIEGSRRNLKVTVAEDIELVEALLAHRKES